MVAIMIKKKFTKKIDRVKMDCTSYREALRLGRIHPSCTCMEEMRY